MEPAIASIVWFAGNFAPKYWAFCSGQIMAISTNQALFSLIGTTYGGNGQTTFALPNLNGRAALGTGQGPGLSSFSLGQVGGAESATMTIATMPQHNHNVLPQVAVTSGAGGSDTADSNILAVTTGTNYAALASANGALGGATITDNPAGGNQPFNLMQPYLGLNFIICLYGVFPSRN